MREQIASPALLAVLLLALWDPAADAATFLTFDPPGSEETLGGSITDAGLISGSYYEGGAFHG